jgi:NADH-quinone oxidoreductase subunit F
MKKERPLTGHLRSDGVALKLREYEAAGGYQGLRTALKMERHQVIKVVRDSTLGGRGGAGFSTGRKWSFVPEEDLHERHIFPHEMVTMIEEPNLWGHVSAGFTTGVKWSFMPKGEYATSPAYVVANADEMEPGVFKDRVLMEGNPHQLLEGMIITAYAIGADSAYIFLRWAYKKSSRCIEKAISEAREAKYLGEHILGTDFSIDIYLHTSAGRYICGEATALLNSLEGRRANPRAKPPHTAAVGLWGRPTDVNNVETLSNVPHILRNGADWYKDLSYTDEGGTKIYGVSGRVRRPGWWELPMGTTAREIIDEHAGGMEDAYRLRAFLPGGASTDFLLAEHLDVRMDVKSVDAIGSRMGCGTMIILDDKTCPVGMVNNVMRFFARESCGWCTPCREGLPWTVSILSALEAGEGRPEDMDRLRTHVRWIGGPDSTFCSLAPGAMEPLQSALRYFEDEFREHIRLHRCPWRPNGGAG